MPKNTSIEKNYLSKDYQKAEILKVHHELTRYLKKYIESKLQDNPKRKICEAMLKELKGMQDKAFKKIDQQTDEDDNHSTPLQYLRDTEKLLTDTQNSIKKADQVAGKGKLFHGKSNVPAMLEKFKTQCKKQEKQLEHAVEATVYKVNVPIDEYARIQDQSKRFYYEGRGTAVAKATLGSVGAYTASGAIGAGVFLDLDAELLEPALEVSLDAAQAGFTRFGRAYQGEFKSEWVEGVVDKRTVPLTQAEIKTAREQKYFELKGVKQTNPKWVDLSKGPKPTHTQTVYVVDCRSPTEIFQNGTRFSEKHKKGKSVYFKDPKDAVRYSRRQTSDKYFSKFAGWRLRNPWSSKQRQEIAQARSTKHGISSPPVRVEKDSPSVHKPKSPGKR